ncbi:MAG: ABC transporter permease, partial [Anaerolineae bacterium]|nr:ABC transporter permease [Anaerolineae bacterium]
MNRFVLNKIGWSFLTVVFVVVLNFFLFRILPGDPARMVRDPRLTQEAIEAIRVRFGLDRPVINCVEQVSPLKLGSCFINPLDTQFFRYVTNLLQGDLGTSFHTQRPVADVLAENLVNTLLLIGPGTILSIILGVFLGLIAAWRSRTAVDYFALLGSLLAWALPTFWFGIILLFWGSSQLGLPIGGKMTVGGNFSSVWEEWLD